MGINGGKAPPWDCLTSVVFGQLQGLCLEINGSFKGFGSLMTAEAPIPSDPKAANTTDAQRHGKAL